MSLMAVVAVAVAYLCIVAFVLSLLASAKRTDAALENEHRRLHRRRESTDDRHTVGEEDPLAENAVRRRAG